MWRLFNSKICNKDELKEKIEEEEKLYEELNKFNQGKIDNKNKNSSTYLNDNQNQKKLIEFQSINFKENNSPTKQIHQNNDLERAINVEKIEDKSKDKINNRGTHLIKNLMI